MFYYFTAIVYNNPFFDIIKIDTFFNFYQIWIFIIIVFVVSNLGGFMVIDRIDTVNLMLIFFLKAIQFNNFILALNWIVSKGDEIIAMSIHFENFPIISHFYTNSTSKRIIDCFKSIINPKDLKGGSLNYLLLSNQTLQLCSF